MKNNFSVSIIIPCFNSERYIEETINSVFLQTISSWECIIINDGSVDRSEEIILNTIGQDKRFKYIYQENKGVCVARNTAIKSSSGEYILCLDADDLISENFLTETVKLLNQNPEVSIATSTVELFGKYKSTLKVVSHSLEKLLANNYIVVTSLFRRKDFDKVGGFKESMKEGFEDWDFWISILKNGGKVECVTSSVFYYRIQKKSRNSQTANANMPKLRFQLWENHKELYSKYYVDPTSYFEYQNIALSFEYKLGKFLFTPFRKIFGR